MRSFLFALPFIVLSFFCWGLYGPLLHEGQYLMGTAIQPSSLRPFICVGISYFLIAVVVPIAMIWTKGEQGQWTAAGAVWSFMAGAAGAIGALGITLAFKFRGNPVYVMPLVFGCAPVVNTFVTMWMARTFKEANVIFYSGVLVVAIGAAGVLTFKPTAKNIEVDHRPDGSIKVTLISIEEGATKTTEWIAPSDQALLNNSELAKAKALFLKKQPLQWPQPLLIALSVGLTALCWGSYGPVLHKGQMKMNGSRMRPFLCVGLAYFVVAVLVPIPLLGVFREVSGDYFWIGSMWSLAAGAAGAIGALGIILAFNFGGKPIFVMPLVFGFAPVVNTLITIWHEGTGRQVTAPFYAALMLVIGGAMTVLIFSPKPHVPKPVKKTDDDGADSAGRVETTPSKPAVSPGGNHVASSSELEEETINQEETLDRA